MFAIINTVQFKGSSDKYSMNSGVKCPNSEPEARAAFQEFLKSHPVKAKLVRTDTGETLATSEYATARIV